MQAFLDKGRLSPVLEAIPVRVILDDTLRAAGRGGVRGGARGGDYGAIGAGGVGEWADVRLGNGRERSAQNLVW